MPASPYISMSYKVDWFQTVEASKFYEFLEFSNSKFWCFLSKLGYSLNDFEEVPARYFYQKGLTLGRYFTIYYNSEKNPYTGASIYFQFTGQGSTDLAQKLAEYYKSEDYAVVWTNFFKLVVDLKLNVTRIDIALDDYQGVLDFDKIERKLARKEFRASKRSYNIVKENSIDGSVKGETIYFGARKKHQNGYIVRLYDKYAEYKSKGAIVPTEVENLVTGEGSHVWQRYEIEIRGSAANNFIAKILAGNTFGAVYKGLMRNAFEFVKVSKSDKKRSRWLLVDWWADFLNGCEKCSLTDPDRDLDLGRLLKWLRVAVVPSLHLLDDIGKVKGFDIYQLLKDVDVGAYAKKQERLKNQALSMPKPVIDKYINEFRSRRRF